MATLERASEPRAFPLDASSELTRLQAVCEVRLPMKIATLLAAAATTAAAPHIDVEQYQLDNGLTVLMSEDKSLPVVATEVVYLVGSGYEAKGRTGFAHLFEHL